MFTAAFHYEMTVRRYSCATVQYTEEGRGTNPSFILKNVSDDLGDLLSEETLWEEEAGGVRCVI